MSKKIFETDEVMSKGNRIADAILGGIVRNGSFFFAVFVIWKLYSWFAVPILGWPILTYGYAFALSFFLGAVTYKIRSSAIEDKIYSEQVRTLPNLKLGFLSLFVYGYLLLIGYIIKLIVI